MTKQCKKCLLWKDITEFCRDNREKGDYHDYCKECHNLYYKKWYERNKQNKILYNKLWRHQNKEKVKIYEQNKKKKFRERIKQYAKKWRERNKEKVKEYIKKWMEKNIKKIKEKKRIYARKRYYNDIKFRIDRIMGCSLLRALKKKKNYKRWEKLVGYTLEDLMKHLESKFTPEMSWDNYGTYWEIDHIIPKSYFKYESPEDEEFKKCWSLENLQPLPKEINRKKGAATAITLSRSLKN
jgi:hypothetical protein